MNTQTADLCDNNREKKIEVLSAKLKNYGRLKEFSNKALIDYVLENHTFDRRVEDILKYYN